MTAIGSASKYHTVISTLREEIVRGMYAPGHRLPNRSEMVERFGAGMATVQKALDDLMADGFLCAQPRKGTFVVERPPHLYCYGLVVPTGGTWSRHYKAMQMAVSEVAIGNDLRFCEYHSSRDVGLRADVTHLSRDVRHHRLAGLIIDGVLSQSGLEGTVVMDEPDMPRVVIEDSDRSGIPAVYGDYECFTDRAIEYLTSKGRKRIAHLCNDWPVYSVLDEFENRLRGRGIEVRPYWVQPVPVAGPPLRTAARMVHTMLQLEDDKRPDALIIYDDNLIEHGLAGLMAAGVKIPDELEIVALSNFPATVSTALPLAYLGFDFHEIVKECLHILEMQRHGEKPLNFTKIPAVFVDELIAKD